VLCDYFVAIDDDAASRALTWEVDWSAPTRPGQSEEFGPVIDGKNIDPFVRLPALQLLLADRIPDQAGADEESCSPVTPDDPDNESVVVRVSDVLMKALADADEVTRAGVTASWLQDDSLGWEPGWDLQTAVAFVDMLAMLALLARTQNEHLYCALSP
jgi:hypothetical protein